MTEIVELTRAEIEQYVENGIPFPPIVKFLSSMRHSSTGFMALQNIDFGNSELIIPGNRFQGHNLTARKITQSAPHYALRLFKSFFSSKDMKDTSCELYNCKVPKVELQNVDNIRVEKSTTDSLTTWGAIKIVLAKNLKLERISTKNVHRLEYLAKDKNDRVAFTAKQQAVFDKTGAKPIDNQSANVAFAENLRTKAVTAFTNGPT